MEEIKPLKDSLEASPAPWTVKVTVKKVPTDVKCETAKIKEAIKKFYDDTQSDVDTDGAAGPVICRRSPTVEYNEDTFYPKAMTDKPYTLVFKDDFIPDISLGRLSANTKAELNRIVKKTVHYRDGPVMGRSGPSGRRSWCATSRMPPGEYAENRVRGAQDRLRCDRGQGGASVSRARTCRRRL